MPERSPVGSKAAPASIAPRPFVVADTRSSPAVSARPGSYSAAYDRVASPVACARESPSAASTSAPTAYVPGNDASTWAASTPAPVRSRGSTRDTPSGPVMRTDPAAPSGHADSPSTVTCKRPPRTSARTLAPSDSGNDSFTTPAQNAAYPSHFAQPWLHRADASLVHAVTRPRPARHEASKGSRSGPTRSHVSAVDFAVVATYPSKGGAARMARTGAAAAVTSGMKLPSLTKLRATSTVSWLMIWGTSSRSVPG